MKAFVSRRTFPAALASLWKRTQCKRDARQRQGSGIPTRRQTRVVGTYGLPKLCQVDARQIVTCKATSRAASAPRRTNVSEQLVFRPHISRPGVISARPALTRQGGRGTLNSAAVISWREIRRSSRKTRHLLVVPGRSDAISSTIANVGSFPWCGLKNCAVDQFVGTQRAIEIECSEP